MTPALFMARIGMAQGWLFDGWSVNLAITFGLAGVAVFVIDKIIDWLDL